MHDGEHPFNQSKGKHETKQIDHIIGAGAVSWSRSPQLAQTSATTTTTTKPAVTKSSTTTTSTSNLDGTGTITTYTPGSDYISFRTTTNAEPVRYY
jgi:hypothetical protein